MSMGPLDYRKATSSVLLVYDDPLLSHCSMIYASRGLSCCCNGFYYSYFTLPMNTILPQVDRLLCHYTKIGVIRSTGDSNIVVYMSMEGQHTIRSLYCYGLLELGLEHRCLLL